MFILDKVVNCDGFPAYGFFFIAPEDVAQAFTTIYGFAPRILKGNDHRVGFGFRFGNHADLQVLYEFGPQTNTRPLQATLIRSARYHQRQVRRPFIEFLIRAGILQTPSYELNIIHDAHDDDDDDGPR
ncbi:uncharacterized protein LOC121727042 [Aricia agestis]|uniref:uncharacterized protein LOC121727042 n=1 Tax=Aricia agestis TaxID=91739 RepID=UPI001C207021|nr:uncharacterized protein LOC121727042 [Aricia agestis]